MRLKVCLGLGVAMLLALGASATETSCPYRMGLLQEDPHTVPWLTEATCVFVAPGAPEAATMSAVDLSGEMPPVGNQVGQGSCVAWSVGYYDKTHTEYVEHGWNDSLREHQVSPAFIYNQINGGRDAGSTYGDAFQLICEQGACMWSDFPYDTSDYASWPSESAYSRGILYRGTSAYYIDVTTDAGINSVKQRLANGQTCVLGISCYDNMFTIKNFDNIYTVYDKYGINRGGHGVCIVGYDDNKDTKDGIGAFKLVNSWGTGWGDNGYWWMSYYAVKNKRAGLSWGNVYYAGDRTDYHPTLLGRVRLTHSARDCIGITFGIGRSRTPAWIYVFRKFINLNQAPQPFPLNNMVFDLSDGAAYLEPTDSVFVQCIDNKKDSQTGSIDYLSAEYVPWGTAGVSPETPVAIPDFKKAVMARLKIPKTLGMAGAPGPHGEPTANAVADSRAEFRDGAASPAFEPGRPGPVRIAVYDATGRAVRTQEVSANSRTGALSIDLGGLNAGVYLVRITGADLTVSRKLVVQR
jgi:C1A family cysteine protease